MNIKNIYAVVIAAILVTLVSSTPYQKCSSGPTPIALRVEGCNALPCQLSRGSNITSELDFQANSKTKVLTPRVRATAFGVTITYPFPEKDSCGSLKSGKCPLDVGQKATHVFVMPVLKAFPKISVTIEFSFLDDAKQTIVCYKLPIKIK